MKQEITQAMRTSLDDFEENLMLNKSVTTVMAYRRDVENFLEYVASKGIKKLGTINSQHITNYLGMCKKLNRSDSSINRYYMSIRSYCRYLRKIKAIANDLTEDVPTPRMKQQAPTILSIEDMQKILGLPDLETEWGIRDLAILELLYSSGLRASELCDLQLNDVQENQVLVRCGKRGKTRTVPITEHARTAIDNYIRGYRGTEEGYLFLTKHKKKLTRGLLCKTVMTYAKKAGLNDVTTHTLRHTCATQLLDAGADLRFIQEVLGHSSIASTQRYTHLSSNKIQSMFQQFHPRK